MRGFWQAMATKSHAVAARLPWLVLLLWMLPSGAVLAQATHLLGGHGSMGLGGPNGEFTVAQDDLVVKVPGGEVRVNRDFDGQQWVFNRQWSGLGSPNYYQDVYTALSAAASCSVIDGISSCDGTAGASINLPSQVVRRGARIQNDPGFGRDTAGQPLPDGAIQTLARKGVAFARSSDGASFTSSKYPRFVVRPQQVQVLPVSASPDAHPVAGKPGQGGLATTLVAGWRWTDRSGEWIEYDAYGRITSYGDRNNARVWFQYGKQDQVERVLDDNGRTVFTFLYKDDGAFIAEARDHTALDGVIRRVQYRYDDAGMLTSVIDVRGNETKFGYQRLAGTTPRYTVNEVTDAEGRKLTVDYGPTERVSKITAADGGATEFDYGYDKLKKEFSLTIKAPQTASGRKIETRRFDVEGRLVYLEIAGKVVLSSDGSVRNLTYTDERGNKTTVARDNFDEITRLTYADGSARNYAYESASTDLREYTDESGAIWRYRRDPNGNVVEQLAAAGKAEQQATEYTYNARGEVEQIRRKGGPNPDGSTDVEVDLQLARDANGNVAEVIDGEGKRWRYEYDAQGNLLTSTDPLGHGWRYRYDAAGNLVEETDPNGHSQHHEYDKTDRLVASTDARGKTTRFGYDAVGRDSTVTDPYGATFVDQYDAAGRLSARTDAAGSSARLNYDSSDRLVRINDGQNYDTLFDYSDVDGVDRGTRKPGKITYPTFQRLFRYDSRDRAVQQTELLGTDTLVLGASHDARGKLKTLTNPSGHTQSFEYDGLGRTVSVIDELGNTVRIGYDHRNNVVSVTDARGKVARMAYDRRGLLASETNAVGEQTRYAYDDAGNLASITRPDNVRVEHQYDAGGRSTQSRSFDAAGNLELTQQYDWDDADNLVGWQTDRAHGVLTYDDADRLLDEKVTIDGVTLARAYSYYPNNKVKTYTGPDGVTLTYGYDGNGELSRLDIPGEGSISVSEWTWTAPKKVVLPGGTVQEMDRDGHQQLLRLRVKGPGQTTLFELENQFGKMRELSSRSVDGKATRFDYDEAVRLVKATPEFSGGTSQTYVLDEAGNRIEQSAVSGTWEYDDANRLLKRGAVSYTYDGAGNVTSRVDSALSEPLRTTRFRYDGFNRLAEVRDGADTVVSRYAYDPFGFRIAKEVLVARNGAELGKTLFLQGEEGLLAEADGNGVVQRSYGWHPEHDYATYPLFQHAGGAYFYYHNDQLGTPWRVTNKEGAIVWSAQDYNAFGKAQVATGAQIVQPWRFPGQYLDVETGLHYNLQRYYESESGRYISEDPLGFGSDTNFYAYARHAPTNLTDPTGEILPLLGCLAWNYLRCVAACSVIDLAGQALLDPCNIDVGGTIKQCLTDCIWDMLPIPNPCGRIGRWIGTAMGIYEGASAVQDAVNSFPGDTQVATPTGLRRIDELRPGDEVQAYAEWEGKTRVERVTDLILSHHEQTLVTLTLENGQVLQATGGHPLRTPTGWRAAQLLQAGGQLDIKGPDGQLAQIKITKVEQRQEVLAVYNLEVSHAHTFFVGEDGVLAHNGFGSYTINFKCGRRYHGKGDLNRARKSAKQRASKHNTSYDEKDIDWTPASSDRQSFIDEHERISRDGGIGPDHGNFNEINSPGKKYSQP